MIGEERVTALWSGSPAMVMALDAALARAALAGYETPKSVVFADALPETVGGKVLKYRLRSIHAAHYDGSEALR